MIYIYIYIYCMTPEVLKCKSGVGPPRSARSSLEVSTRRFSVTILHVCIYIYIYTHTLL